jgi:hypothetical protein
VNDPFATLLKASVAEQLTVVVPIENVVPDVGEQLIRIGLALSVADAA